MVSIIRPDSCRTCKFGIQLNDVPKGEPDVECHGAPPQVVALVIPGQAGPQISVQTVWPRVNLDWSCGCWKPRIQAVN